ncbi:hypothetical protein FHS09_000308 [Microbulbifer rhizosphaerae]|uniref:Uncharacterized protein n=1 Tax=Microbulbifer rhizosphaerae TaxID=1562603 RepID=A0A7W4W872_9GAMM|nr:hypothetical protein [Microbulbifer rhizosphaerae]
MATLLFPHMVGLKNRESRRKFGVSAIRPQFPRESRQY